MQRPVIDLLHNKNKENIYVCVCVTIHRYILAAFEPIYCKKKKTIKTRILHFRNYISHILQKHCLLNILMGRDNGIIAIQCTDTGS